MGTGCIVFTKNPKKKRLLSKQSTIETWIERYKKSVEKIYQSADLELKIEDDSVFVGLCVTINANDCFEILPDISSLPVARFQNSISSKPWVQTTRIIFGQISSYFDRTFNAYPAEMLARLIVHFNFCGFSMLVIQKQIQKFLLFHPYLKHELVCAQEVAKAYFDKNGDQEQTLQRCQWTLATRLFVSCQNCQQKMDPIFKCRCSTLACVNCCPLHKSWRCNITSALVGQW